MDRTEGEIPPFQRFLEEHRAVVYRFLLAAAGPQEADDCFQETFLSALKAYPRLRHADNLRGWVLAIATRKAIDAGRARSRRPVPVERMPEVAGAGDDPLVPFDPVWDAVRSLPPRQRVALVHRVVLDQSYAEMAAAMGGSVETARANVYQALKKLRSEVTER
jgi:RNA polymerase sigma factor (sigma-70 family)